MCRNKCLLAVLVFLTAMPVFGAPTSRELLGRNYVRQGGDWVQRDAAGREYRVNPRVISVKFRSEVSRVSEEALNEALDATELRRAMTGFVDIKIQRGQDVFDAIDAYLASDLVEIAEPNTFGTYTVIPNDPSYGSQYFLPITDSEEAWDTTAGDPSIIVAVLDSGTEFTHEDLGMGADGYENIWLNSGEDAWVDPENPNTGNGVDDDFNGYVDDWKGYNFSEGDNDSSGPFFHGTAVAGMTAAKTNNGVGVASVSGGFGSAGTSIMIAGVGNLAPDSAVLDDAILYAGMMGAHVIQLSLSVGQSAAIDAAVDMAFDTYGMTIICSSGNGGAPSVSYPSSLPKIIAVGSTNSADLRSSFSNHGPDVEVSAPGENVFTLDLNDGYDFTGGTSFSAPLTSGVVALMLAANPSLTNTEIRQILHDTADKVGPYDYNWNGSMPGHSFELGYGRVNANAAVAAAGPSSTIFADGFESGDTSAWP